MPHPLKVVIIGAGARGNRVFADLIARHDTGFVTAAVVELDPERRRAFQERYNIPDERAFAMVEDFLKAPRLGDIVFICTPDPTHYSLCRAVSERGYDILLEKPIATNLPDCLAMLEVEASSGNRIFVAHVLRYSPFFRKVRHIVQEGKLGRIRNIRLSENVGHWHFAHSYVRGSWRRRDLSAPVILTKSSHDLDILVWLVGDRVRNVTSTGALTYFTAANAPVGAARRCADCPHEESCLYSATRFYLNDRQEWPFNVIAPPPDTLELRRRAVMEGPYGNCVWHNDNDVCDTQTVLMEFANGIHATFELQALTADNTRQLRVLFDSAELVGDLHRGSLEISHFTGRKDELRVEPVPIPEAEDSHGGGDPAPALLAARSPGEWHRSGGDDLSAQLAAEPRDCLHRRGVAEEAAAARGAGHLRWAGARPGASRTTPGGASRGAHPPGRRTDDGRGVRMTRPPRLHRW